MAKHTKALRNNTFFQQVIGIIGVISYLVAIMKESFHLCFTSHDEVMFRSPEDHAIFLNLLALRGFAEQTEIWADAQMSTHVHLNVYSDKPQHFASNLRLSYTRAFNKKYGRSGRFGEKYTFQLLVQGFVHQMILLNYILRNGLHHNAAATAFGYEYCSIRDMFAEDLLFKTETPVRMSRKDIASFLPRHAEFPDEFQMNANGVFVRRSFMELRKAEQYYGSPRNFLYQMNRLTDESWVKEQMEKDRGRKPLTLGDIEHASAQSVAQMLKNETGRNFSRSRLQDLDVCRLIDQEILPGYGVTSPYLLKESQKQNISNLLFHEFHLPETQIRRCLVYPSAALTIKR